MRERIEIISDNVMLYHGDSVELLKELPAGSVDMIFTDPPYGHKNNDGDLISKRELFDGPAGQAKKVDTRPIANDGAEDAHRLITALFKEMPRLLPKGGACCCCGGGGGPDPQFARWSLLLNEHLKFKQMVVWDKGPMGMGWHYRRSYEVVLVAEKPGGPSSWYATADNIENIIRPGQYGIKKIIPQQDQHPTQKPWELAAHFMRLHSQPGDVILDPFMGSGSTGVAAVKLGRGFIGFELDPHWFDYAVKEIRAEVKRPKLFDNGYQKTERMKHSSLFGEE